MAESTRLELATSGVTGGFSFCTVHECFLNEAQIRIWKRSLKIQSIYFRFNRIKTQVKIGLVLTKKEELHHVRSRNGPTHA